jgi:hypothetical protein
MEFIELTFNGRDKKLYIEKNSILSFYLGNYNGHDMTFVITTKEDYQVSETPQQIIELINNNGGNK